MSNIDDPIFRRYQLEIATKVDQIEGFKQVELLKENKPLCAFATHGGRCETNVMTIILTNASATFQRMMNEVLREEIDKCCLVYLDEVLIFWSSRESNYREVYVVCFRLLVAGSRLKSEKLRNEHVVYETQNLPSKLRQSIVDNSFVSTLKRM